MHVCDAVTSVILRVEIIKYILNHTDCLPTSPSPSPSPSPSVSLSLPLSPSLSSGGAICTAMTLMIFRHLSRSVASCDAAAMSSFVYYFKSWNHVVAGLPLSACLPSSVASIFSPYRFFRAMWPNNLLPNRHTFSQHQNRPNLLQHPLFSSPSMTP